jgi:MFS family permease
MSTPQVERANDPPDAVSAEPTPAAGNGKLPARGATTGQGGLAVLRVLRHQEFAIFWAGQAVSLVGTWMQAYAQGLVVTGLTTQASALGLLNFAGSLPSLILMPFGGVAADRIERRRILVVTQWIMLAMAVAMGLLLQAGKLELWHVFVIAFVLGVATAYDMPAYQAFYPQLVEKPDLPQAIALNQATFHGARIIGPAFAAAIVKLFGMAGAFYANAASFLAVILSLGFVRSRPPAVTEHRGSTASFMKEGYAYVRAHPRVQALLLLTAATTLFVFPNMAVLTPYYARYVLGLPDGQVAGGLSWIMSVSGAGALLGSAILLSVPSEDRVRRMTVCAVTMGCALSVFAWSRSLWVSVGAVAFLSLSISQTMGLASIIVQEQVPDHLRGRVMSLYSLMFTGVMPFAALLISRTVDLIGMRLELQISAIFYTLAVLLLMRRLRGLDNTLPTELTAE